MEIISMEYSRPVKKMFAGTDYHFVEAVIKGATPDDKLRLEKIARQTTGFFETPMDIMDINNGKRFRGLMNAAEITEIDGIVRITLEGYYATIAGQGIEQLPDVQFSPSREEVVEYA